MNCPTKNTKIQNQLCKIFYPYCKIRCKKLYNRWLKTEEEVQKLEGLEIVICDEGVGLK